MPTAVMVTSKAVVLHRIIDRPGIRRETFMQVGYRGELDRPGMISAIESPLDLLAEPGKRVNRRGGRKPAA